MNKATDSLQENQKTEMQELREEMIKHWKETDWKSAKNWKGKIRNKSKLEEAQNKNI